MGKCEEEKNYTYLVRCADGTFYCGWTNHLDERVEAHNAGRGAKYTKSRRPVELVYYEEFVTKQEAMRREWVIKHLTRSEKEELISGYAGTRYQYPASEHAVYEFPLGFLYVGYEDGAVVSLKKIDKAGDYGQKTELTDQVFAQIMEYLEGKRREFDFTYRLKGTEFQKKVWQQLLRIPYGETRTYKEIAIAAGNPKASRAVGMANNKNPIAIAVPCHRVIGSSGKLVGYAGGLDMKRALLELEQLMLQKHTS